MLCVNVNLVTASTLTEIATVGEIDSITPFLPNIEYQHVDIDIASTSKLLMETAVDSISKEMFFPLVSKMSVGRIESRRFPKKLNLRPFAIAGSDPVSKQWLSKRGAVLAELRSPIFIIQAESMADIQSLARQFPKLRFIPSAGDGVLNTLSLSKYPVLITSNGVWQ